MNYKRINFSFLLSILCLALSFSSCIEDQISRTYAGSPVVEFKNQYLEIQSQIGASNMSIAYPSIVTSENTSLTSLTVKQPASTPYADRILVQLVGPLNTKETQIGFSIAGTAQAGTHFSLDERSASNKITIPAGSNSGYIYLNALNGGLTSGQRVAIEFTLTGGEGISPSENYKKFTYNITF